MLVTWLAELYLNELGKLKEEDSSRYVEVQEAFRNFLAQVCSARYLFHIIIQNRCCHKPIFISKYLANFVLQL